MKRDVELTRRLLLEIERRGAECPIDALRSELCHDTEERIRCHVRQLLDAGWIKEVAHDHDSGLFVRLTHAGQEFVELARGEHRWRAAKALVIDQTGGTSLTILRAVLTRWAWRSVAPSVRHRRAGRRYYRRPMPEGWFDALEPDQTSWDDDQILVARRRPNYRERFDLRHGWNTDLYCDLEAELADHPPTVELPQDII